MNEYVCNLHVHTTYSDGTGTVEEIARAARNAGVDVVGITDHHRLMGLSEGKEGWHGGILALIGMEIGHDHNHYLAWRVHKEVEDTGGPQAVIDAVRGQGGIGFIAHPFEKGCRYTYSGKAFTWENWNVTGFTGICIWNFTSRWKELVNGPLTAIYYYLNRKGAVRGPDQETLAKWDSFLAKGRVVAIGGTDAHAIRSGFSFIRPRIFPYGYLFKTINTHILTEKEFTGDLVADRKLVYGALERGHCFVCLDLLGSGRGFEFTALADGGKAIMGDEILLSGSVKLQIKLPVAAHVRVIRDGSLWREGFGAVHMYTAKKPGVYRVEAFRKGAFTGKLRAWIFSNPIYVRA